MTQGKTHAIYLIIYQRLTATVAGTISTSRHLFRVFLCFSVIRP
jgi:hypothetical protein